jgi:hypothetical protein
MPRQTELQDLRITLGREYATAEHLIPLFDHGFNTRYYILDLGEGKVALIDLHQMRKIGDDITIDLTSSASNMALINPMVFMGTFHGDPWGMLGRVADIADQTRDALAATNLFGKRVGGQKVSDLLFHEDLGFVEHIELRSMGFMKRILPVGEFIFQSNGSIALKAPAAPSR